MPWKQGLGGLALSQSLAAASPLQERGSLEGGRWDWRQEVLPGVPAASSCLTGPCLAHRQLVGPSSPVLPYSGAQDRPSLGEPGSTLSCCRPLLNLQPLQH